jgi:HEAT repeat protein
MVKSIRVALLLPALIVMAASLRAAQPTFEDLVANLKSPNDKTRQEAAAALGKSRRREAVTPLATLVRDPEPKVRLEMVRALRELRDLGGVSALVTTLGDGDPEIRREAISGLVEIYAERERSGPVGRFLRLFSDEYERASVPAHLSVDPAVIEGLSRRLRDEDKGAREAAALALGILDGRAAVKDLVGALQDPDADVRGAVVIAIGKVGTAAEGRALIPLLSDESAEVRNRVLHALGVLRVREAGPALRELYEQNRRRELGVKVLATLSKVGDPAQAPLFVELMQDPDPEKKRWAVEGLGRISDGSRLAGFKKDYQRERNEEVKLAYSFAIARMGDRAFVDSLVLALPSRTLGSRSRGYLVEMGPEVLPELYPYLSDPDAQVRGALCDVIGELEDPAAIPRLTPLLNDPSREVVDRANRAVERLRRRDAKASR